jgi:hypothetical protein
VLINLSEGLINNKQEVIVVSESEGPMWDILSGKIEKIKIKELQRAIDPWKDLKVIWRLRKIYRKYKPNDAKYQVFIYCNSLCRHRGIHAFRRYFRGSGLYFSRVHA